MDKVHSVAYRGSEVECLACGWQGQKFFDGRCPRCRSMARGRLPSYGINHFGIDLNNKTLLHIGPNVSEIKSIELKFNPARYIKFDIKPHKHVNMIGDMTDMQIPDSSIDNIVIWHVLEHIPDDKKAISEMYRVLKPGGSALVSVPIHPQFSPTTFEDFSIPREKYEEIHGHFDHCRSCGLDYYERFAEAGFKVNFLINDNIPEAERKKYGLSRGHVAWQFVK